MAVFLLTSYTRRELLLGSVTMQAQRELPRDMQCKDKFLVQSAIVSKDITPKDITAEMVTHDLMNTRLQHFSLCWQFCLSKSVRGNMCSLPKDQEMWLMK